MLGTGLSCLLGLLVGGVLGGFAITLLQQVRSGQVKVPPSIEIGPLKLDTSGIAPQIREGDERADWDDVAPYIEVGGSMTSGCLALIGGGMVLVGFLLPWFSCSIPLLLSGSFSGFSMLLQLIAGVFLSSLGIFGSDSNFAAIGGALAVLLILVTAILVLIPLMGFRIGRTGLKLVQAPKITNQWRREISRNLIWTAIVGLIPMFCYLTSATAQFSGISTLGVSVRSADTGLWVTLAGFVVAIVAGIVISTAAALSEQLPKSTRAVAPKKRPAVSQGERQVLVLIAEGLGTREIVDRLGMTELQVRVITTGLLDKFSVASTRELIEEARAQGFAPPSQSTRHQSGGEEDS